MFFGLWQVWVTLYLQIKKIEYLYMFKRKLSCISSFTFEDEPPLKKQKSKMDIHKLLKRVENLENYIRKLEQHLRLDSDFMDICEFNNIKHIYS